MTAPYEDAAYLATSLPLPSDARIYTAAPRAETLILAFDLLIINGHAQRIRRRRHVRRHHQRRCFALLPVAATANALYSPSDAAAATARFYDTTTVLLRALWRGARLNMLPPPL